MSFVVFAAGHSALRLYSPAALPRFRRIHRVDSQVYYRVCVVGKMQILHILDTHTHRRHTKSCELPIPIWCTQHTQTLARARKYHIVSMRACACRYTRRVHCARTPCAEFPHHSSIMRTSNLHTYSVDVRSRLASRLIASHRVRAILPLCRACPHAPAEDAAWMYRSAECSRKRVCMSFLRVLACVCVFLRTRIAGGECAMWMALCVSYRHIGVSIYARLQCCWQRREATASAAAHANRAAMVRNA